VKAWLVTWEWIGDHAKSEEKVASVLDARLSGARVREFVEFLYVSQNSSTGEKIAWARNKKLNPYPARFGALDGIEWQGQIECGHNPWLFARLVDDLAMEVDAQGHEKVTWKERPRPRMAITES